MTDLVMVLDIFGKRHFINPDHVADIYTGAEGFGHETAKIALSTGRIVEVFGTAVEMARRFVEPAIHGYDWEGTLAPDDSAPGGIDSEPCPNAAGHDEGRKGYR